MAALFTSQGSHWELREPSHRMICGIQKGNRRDFSASWCVTPRPFWLDLFFNTKKHDLLWETWETHVNLKKDWNSMKFYSIPSISDKVGYDLLGFVTWVSIVESCTKLSSAASGLHMADRLHLCCKFQACRIQSQCCTPCTRHGCVWQ